MKTIWYAIKTHTQQWCSGIAPCSLLDKKVRPVCFTRFYQWDLVCILFSFILGPLVHRMIWAASIKKKLKQRSQPGTNFIKIHHLASRTEQKMHLLYSLLGKKPWKRFAVREIAGSNFSSARLQGLQQWQNSAPSWKTKDGHSSR